MQVLAPRSTSRLRLRISAFSLLCTLVPLPLTAQNRDPRVRPDPPLYWGVDVSTATLSALVQGRARDVSPLRALVGGVVGGSTMYLGQRLVGTGCPALRFAGLQTVATGASVARNLGTGQSPFAMLTFPVFPLYVQVRPRGGPHLSVRASAVAIGGIVHTAHEFGAWPDWRESLLAGMPVFAVREGRLGGCLEYSRVGQCVSGVVGHHVFGAVAYASRPNQYSARNVLTHELGHAAQDVRDAVLHAVPASDYVLGTDRVGRFIARFVVVDVALPLNVVSRAAGPPNSDPACKDLSSYYECETEAMMPALP